VDALRPRAAPAASRLPHPLTATGVVLVTGVLLGLAALRVPAATAFVVVALAVAAVALRDLAGGVALFTALTFFERIPGAGPSVTAVKLASALLLVAWLGQAWLHPQRPFLPRDRATIAWLMIVFAFWAAASTLWAANVSWAAAGAFRLAQMLFLTFLVFSAVRTVRQLRWLVRAYVAGAALTSVIGLVSGAAFQAGSDRFRGDFGNPNNLAAVVLPAIVLAGFSAALSSRPLERWLLTSAGIVLVATLFLTQSRGGFVGLAAMILAALVFAGPFRARAVALVLCLAVAAVAYFGAIAPPSAQRVGDYSGASSTGRVDLWGIALDISRHHPLLGVGADNYTAVAPGYLARNRGVARPDLFLQEPQPVHNTYLEMLTDLGAVGALLFVLVVGGILRAAVSSVRALARSGDRESELVGRALVIGAVGMLTAYAFFSAQYEKQLWVILGALVSLSTLASTNRRRDQGRRAAAFESSGPRTP
jgi:O-antigen ligase